MEDLLTTTYLAKSGGSIKSRSELRKWLNWSLGTLLRIQSLACGPLIKCVSEGTRDPFGQPNVSTGTRSTGAVIYRGIPSQRRLTVVVVVAQGRFLACFLSFGGGWEVQWQRSIQWISTGGRSFDTLGRTEFVARELANRILFSRSMVGDPRKLFNWKTVFS